MNAAEPQNTYTKILVTGAFTTGKSAFIQTITEIQVVSGPGVPIVLDIGRISAVDSSGAVALYLLGKPGAIDHVNWRRQIPNDLTGIVLMVDSRRYQHHKYRFIEEPQEELPNLLDELPLEVYPHVVATNYEETQSILAELRRDVCPFVVAANYQDDPTAFSLTELQAELALTASETIVPCIATDRASVKAVLLTLLEKIAHVPNALKTRVREI